MTELEFKTAYYQSRGFTPSWNEYVKEVANRDSLEEWGAQKSEQRIIPPLPFTKPKKHPLSAILP